MQEKGKRKPEAKVKIVKKYMAGEAGRCRAAAEAGVDRETLRGWVMQYEAEGAAAFLPGRRNHAYSPEIRLQAVQEYLSGKGSQAELSRKYGLRDRKQLRNWLKVYNAHGDFNSGKNSGGGSCMKQGRDTTQEERVQIVRDCLASGKNYGETALKYRVICPASRYAPGHCGSRRWARPVRRIGAGSGRRTRYPEPSWRKRRSRSSSSGTSCIWRK